MASWKAELNGSSDGGGVYCSGSLTTVCTSADGKFKFKAPNSGADKYTITYTGDDSKTTTKEYTVNAGDCINCDCNKIGFTASTVSKEGGNVKLGTFDVTSDYCESTYPVTASDVAGGIATGTQVKNGNEVWGNVPENESGEKTITFNLSINGNPCQKTTTQGAGCNCGNLTLSPSQISFPNTGYNGEVASYSLDNGCNYNKVGIQGDTSVFSLDTSSHKVTASVGANPSYTDPRNFSYTLTYNNGTCTGKGQTISQGASPVPCQGCTTVSISISDRRVSENGYNGRVGTYSVGSGCEISKVGLASSSDSVFSISNGTINANVPAVSSDETYSFSLTYDGASVGCPSDYIYQKVEESPCTDFAVAGEAFVKCGVVSTAYGGRGTCGYISGECGEPDAIVSVEQYCVSSGDDGWISDLMTYYENNKYKWRAKVSPNNSGHDRVAVFKITTTWGGVYYFRTVQAAGTTPEDPNCQTPGTAVFSGSIRPSTFSDCTSPLSCS